MIKHASIDIEIEQCSHGTVRLLTTVVTSPGEGRASRKHHVNHVLGIQQLQTKSILDHVWERMGTEMKRIVSNELGSIKPIEENPYKFYPDVPQLWGDEVVDDSEPSAVEPSEKDPYNIEQHDRDFWENKRSVNDQEKT